MKNLKYYKNLIRLKLFSFIGCEAKKDLCFRKIKELKDDAALDVFDSSIEKKLLNSFLEKDVIVYFHHNLSGGCDFYLKNEIEKLRSINCIFVLSYNKLFRKIRCDFFYDENQFSFLFFNDKDLLNFFNKIVIKKIIINQISTFPSLDDIFNLIRGLKQESTSITMLIHDYFCITPAIHLLNFHDNISQERNLKWEEFFLKDVNEIICFSNSSKEIILNFYPRVERKIKHIPHGVMPLSKVYFSKISNAVHIGVIGAFIDIKGKKIIEKMAELIDKSDIPVKIFVTDKRRSNSSSVIKFLGNYERADLPKIIAENEIDIIFISSICYETFSYTTHEAMTMGLKVACFNLGAQAESVAKYDKGLIISKIDPEIALNEIINFAK